jgi:oxidase EvaA
MLPIRDALARGYLRSAIRPDGPELSMKDVEGWLAGQSAAQRMTVERVRFSAMRDWALVGSPLRLAHRSGRFFSIQGLRVEADFGPVAGWDQPIIHQPEIGILGIITRVFGGVRHFLMQAKSEPGNVNGVQISPTVQATRSNFTRIHGGARPAYLEYFTDRRARLLVDQLQGEQGSRFLRKQNRNMIVEVDEDVPLGDRFCWMTLAQIKQLLNRPNVVNMDTRTVLACLPLLSSDEADGLAGAGIGRMPDDMTLGNFAAALLSSALHGDRGVHGSRELLHWLTDLRATYRLDLEPRGIDALDGWELDDDALRRKDGRYFSVIGVAVENTTREVSAWHQPLVAHHGYGLNGFVLQRIDGVLHFLVRACMYPGNLALFELGSTVSRSNAEDCFGTPDAPPYLDLFRNPPVDWIRYDAVQSEEGGRFFHYQNRYMLLEIPPDVRVVETAAHRWMTLAQIQDLLSHGYFNIEGRSLLACLDLSGEPVA